MVQTAEDALQSLVFVLQATFRRLVRRAWRTFEYLDELAREGALGADLREEIELDDMGYITINMEYDDIDELP